MSPASYRTAPPRVGLPYYTDCTDAIQIRSGKPYNLVGTRSQTPDHTGLKKVTQSAQRSMLTDGVPSPKGA